MDAALPYELRALEAALSAAARLLEAETGALEARALPSLHSLTQKVAALAHNWCCWSAAYLTVQQQQCVYVGASKDMLQSICVKMLADGKIENSRRTVSA